MSRSTRRFDDAAHDSGQPVSEIKVVGTISSGPGAMTSIASPLTYWAWPMVTGRRVIHVNAGSGWRGTRQGRGSHGRRATAPRHAGPGSAFRSRLPAAA